MKKRDEILGIMLPDQQNTNLLTNVSIAEIFTLNHEHIREASQWLQVAGQPRKIQWRNTEIFLYHLNEYISNEYAINDLQILEKPRVAVINPVTKPGLPLYAVLATNTPRLTRLKFSDLSRYSGYPSSEAIAYSVQLNQDEVLIPNLMYIESQARLMEQNGTKVL
jgi:hypothetical protein